MNRMVAPGCQWRWRGVASFHVPFAGQGLRVVECWGSGLRLLVVALEEVVLAAGHVGVVILIE